MEKKKKSKEKVDKKVKKSKATNKTSNKITKKKLKEIINNILDFIKKNKYIIIGIVVLLLIIIIIACFSNKKEENVPIDETINVTDYKKISTKRSNKTISKKYNLKKYKIRETKDDIELNNLIGKVLYVRSEDFNANIFQTKEKIKIEEDDKIPILMQVERSIEYLRNGALSYIGLDKNAKPMQEVLTGESKFDFPMPLRESIYTEKREYSATYIGPNRDKYDINFYMDGDYLVCELVKFLELDKKEKK